jgi:hypothetical protein
MAIDTKMKPEGYRPQILNYRNHWQAIHYMITYKINNYTTAYIKIIVKINRDYKFNWYEHILRMDSDRIPQEL